MKPITKKSTDREKWLFLGRAFRDATPRYSFTPSKMFEAKLFGHTTLGICYALTVLDKNGISTSRMEKRLSKCLDDYLGPYSAFLFPFTKDGCNKRAALCRRFARECGRRKVKARK